MPGDQRTETPDLPMSEPPTAEHLRLADSAERRADWKRWGPYLAERAWGTVREDYSAEGNAWDYFPHDHARSRAYRWNEDGLAGFCNRYQNLCLALALWNGRDPFLKERLFGLANEEGNHGEDVKEYYYYLDGLPSHAYMRMLYKYPQVEYPYARLVEENRRRGRSEREYELVNALGEALAAGHYFDVVVEYAKASQEDILCRVTAYNRGPEAAELHILPHAWYRNTWAWGYGKGRHPLWKEAANIIRTEYRHFGDRWWYLDDRPHRPELLFTENETNRLRLFGVPNDGPYVKDGFHEAVVGGHHDRVNPEGRGSKAAGHYRAMIEPGGSMTVRTRLADGPRDDPFGPFDAILAERAGRGRCVLSRHPAAGAGRRPAASTAPGVRRAPVVEAVLPLQRGVVARGRSGRTGTAAEPPAGPELGVGARL